MVSVKDYRHAVCLSHLVHMHCTGNTTSKLTDRTYGSVRGTMGSVVPLVTSPKGV